MERKSLEQELGLSAADLASMAISEEDLALVTGGVGAAPLAMDEALGRGTTIIIIDDPKLPNAD